LEKDLTSGTTGKLRKKDRTAERTV
jgi:hypothetical protein